MSFRLYMLVPLLLIGGAWGHAQDPPGPPTGVELFIGAAHGSRADGLWWSPDGKALATSDRDVVVVWDLRTKLPRVTLVHPTGIWGGGASAAWRPDGAAIATTSHDAVVIWNSRTGKLIKRLEDAGDCAVWSPDGRLLATGVRDNNGRVLFWHGQSGELAFASPRLDRPPKTLKWSADSASVAGLMYDESAVILDGNTGGVRSIIKGVQRDIAWRPARGRRQASEQIAAIDGDYCGGIWNAKSR